MNVQMPQVDPDLPVLIIGVMGVTGSGKSTFIQHASGLADVVVGHSLEACTQKVTPYTFVAGGYNVILVDTPGFNDTYKSDTEILVSLATWLEGTYRSNTRLNGIIYLHRITDVRMDGGGMRNLKMFRKLCGPEPMKNVVIASSFWGVIPDERAIDHEMELKSTDEFWGDMIEHGARVTRFMGDRESALGIISDLAGKSTVVLDLQRELVDENKPIAETNAGNAVNQELHALERRYQSDLRQLQQETTEALAAKDLELQKVVEKEREKTERRLERIHQDQELLRQERRDEIRRILEDSEMRFQIIQEQNNRRLERERVNAETRWADERRTFREQMEALHVQSSRLEAQSREEVARLRKEKASLESRLEQEDQGAATNIFTDADESDSSMSNSLHGEKPPRSRRRKWLKVGGQVLGIAASGAMCAVNPVAIPAVIGGIVSLINTLANSSG